MYIYTYIICTNYVIFYINAGKYNVAELACPIMPLMRGGVCWVMFCELLEKVKVSRGVVGDLQLSLWL